MFAPGGYGGLDLSSLEDGGTQLMCCPPRKGAADALLASSAAQQTQRDGGSSGDDQGGLPELLQPLWVSLAMECDPLLITQVGAAGGCLKEGHMASSSAVLSDRQAGMLRPFPLPLSAIRLLGWSCCTQMSMTWCQARCPAACMFAPHAGHVGLVAGLAAGGACAARHHQRAAGGRGVHGVGARRWVRVVDRP
jgi:hypothetical protein